MKKNHFIAIAICLATILCCSLSNYYFCSENADALAEPIIVGNTVICYSSSTVNPLKSYYDCGSCKRILWRSGEGVASTCIHFEPIDNGDLDPNL